MNDQCDMEEDLFIAGLRRVFAGNPALKPATVCADAGLDKSTIRMMFEGRSKSPKVSTCVAIARALGLTVEKILALEQPPVRVENGEVAPPMSNLVPVFDVSASAGHGTIVGDEEQVYSLAFGSDFLQQMTSAPARDLVIIKVKGHSMEPTLLDDDQVLVDRSKTNLSFDGLFVLRFDEALHVKRIGRSASKGSVMVLSDHPSYPSLDMPKADLAVVGRVLWYGRKV